MAKRAMIPFALLALVGSQMLFAAGSVSAAAPLFSIAADQPQAVPVGHLWAFNDYFPRTVTVATGSTFQFIIQGFHTATILPTTVTVAQDLAAAGIVKADTDDTTRNPSGTTHTELVLGALAPVTPTAGCGTPDKPCTFDGTSVLSNGLDITSTAPPAPFVVTVTAPAGTYTFHCRIHPAMTGTMNVVAAGAAGVTTADSATADSATQAAADVAAGTAAEAAYSKAAVKTNADGTHTWTIAAGTSTADGHVAILEFLPRKLHVRKGDKVTWAAHDINEPHTVTFPGELHRDQVPMCEGANGTDTPAVPTVNPPTGPQDFACGNGPADEIEFAPGGGSRTLLSGKTVSDSGIMASKDSIAGFGLPTTAARTTWTVRVSPKAYSGRYHYVCQIHDGMSGVLTVSGG